MLGAEEALRFTFQKKKKQSVNIDDRIFDHEEPLAIWTVKDQMKLESMDGLYSRFMEFHKNVHTRETPLTLFPTMNGTSTETAEHDETVVNVAILSNDKSRKLFEQMNYSQFTKFLNNTFKRKMRRKSEIAKPKEPEYFWIHLKDLDALEIFMNIFQIRESIAAGFYDLRAHSTFLNHVEELFFSHIICLLNETSFRMFKYYIYMRGNILVTYEVELFPAFDAEHDRSSTRATAHTIHRKTTPTRESKTDDTNPDYFETLNNSSSIVTDKIMLLFFSNIVKLRKKVLELGIFYIVYEISLFFLSKYDTTIEFISSTLSYFNRIIPLNLLHRERSKILLKIHMISAGLLLISKAIEEVVETYQSVCKHLNILQEKERQKRLYISSLLKQDPSECHLTQQHSLYLIDLLDSYYFKKECVEKQNEELERLESELNSLMELRVTNTNTIFSLVATAFLPLTFLATVFGMNFTVAGGFSITLLNEPYGDTVFICMCLGSFVACIIFFVYLGWLEFGIFATIFKKLNRVRVDDSNKVDLDASDEKGEKVLQRAEEEENRRHDEAMMMRASYSNFSHPMSKEGGIGRRGSTGLRRSQFASKQQPQQSPGTIPVETNYPQLAKQNQDPNDTHSIGAMSEVGLSMVDMSNT